MALDAEKLKTHIETVVDLPTLPTIASKIASSAANPKTNAADIGELIEQDQALTSKVLRLVNSAYYGFPRQIKSIQHAVVILGFNKVKSIVLTASVFDLINTDVENRINIKKFWQHSLATAIGAKCVANLLANGLAAEDAFIGGLLHDIGKIVMDQFLPEIYTQVIEYAQSEDISLLEAEMDMIGFSHALIGSWILGKWRLPPLISNIVQYHHLPNLSPEHKELVSYVHIGDFLSKALGVGYSGDDYVSDLNSSVVNQYSLTVESFDKLIDSFIHEIEKAADFFNLVGS